MFMSQNLELTIMAEAASKRIAVVTGANKGIGLEICRQLASKGAFVILTARDEKRGLEAVNSLKAEGLSDVIFHQLDVMDSVSIASFAEFIRPRFGRLDILVNNAGVTGSLIKAEDRKHLKYDLDYIVGPNARAQKKYVEQTYETAKSCLRTNYYGIKQLTEALIPVLEQSSSARIVNVSSSLGQLAMIPNEKAKKELGEVDSLTEERIDKLAEGFLEDVKDDTIDTKGWPTLFSAYIVSKALLNAYTRTMAKKYPKMAINAVCPGFTRTDLNDNAGVFTVEEGARGPVMLALMPEGEGSSPSGCFFRQTEMSSF